MVCIVLWYLMFRGHTVYDQTWAERERESEKEVRAACCMLFVVSMAGFCIL